MWNQLYPKCKWKRIHYKTSPWLNADLAMSESCTCKLQKAPQALRNACAIPIPAAAGGGVAGVGQSFTLISAGL